MEPPVYKPSVLNHKIIGWFLFPLQSQQPKSSGDSPLMRALDLDEQEQFKGMESNEALLKVVNARNRKREEYNELKEFLPKEMFLAQLEAKRNEIQSLAQRINNLKQQQQTEKSN